MLQWETLMASSNWFPLVFRLLNYNTYTLSTCISEDLLCIPRMRNTRNTTGHCWKRYFCWIFFSFNVISVTVTGNISVPVHPIETHLEEVLEQKPILEQHFLTIKYRSGIFLTMFMLFLLPAPSDIMNLPWYTEKCRMIITKRLLKAPQQGGSGKRK